MIDQVANNCVLVRHVLLLCEVLQHLCRVDSLLVLLPNENSQNDLGHIFDLDKLSFNEWAAFSRLYHLFLLVLLELKERSLVVIGWLRLVEQLACQVNDMEQVCQHDMFLNRMLVVVVELLVSIVLVGAGRSPDTVEHKRAFRDADLPATSHHGLRALSSSRQSDRVRELVPCCSCH